MRRVAVFTGNRAEWSSLEPVVRAIEAHPELEPRVIVTSNHQADVYRRDATVLVDTLPDTLLGASIGLSRTSERMSTLLDSMKPDILLCYGDRSETFAAVVAGSQLGIPVAHLEGGDWTEGGALDDNLRHAATKLAHIHLCTNGYSHERVLALGEEPWRVFTVGLPSLDRVTLLPDADTSYPVIAVLQHPIATEAHLARAQIIPTIEACTRAVSERGVMIMIEPNGDPGSSDILAEMAASRAIAYPHLSCDRFHRLLSLASCLVGNSSSGIKEAPAFGCPFVNVGTRQQGRLRGNNVIDVGYDADAIYAAIQRAIGWRKEGRTFTSPYGGRGASQRVADVLATVTLDIRKRLVA